MIMGSRNPDRELSTVFEPVLDVWSSDDGVEPPNLRDGFKSKIPCQHGDEYLHLQDSKSPPDA